MKRKLPLILMLLSSLLLLNCSGKKNQRLPSQATRPANNPSILTPPIKNTNHSLGRPINSPLPIPIENESTSTTPVKEEPSNTPPVMQQPIAYGKSNLYEKATLSNLVKESSGLIKIDHKLWTLNDSGGQTKLYQIDERNGKIIKSINIHNARNKDWEDIAYDDTYVYIGDFGNNRGNRKDLKIYKIPRASLRTQNSVKAEVIQFKYNDQRNFKSRLHKHNYDCEAMIAHNGKLYLFSKNWQDYKTRMYELSTTAGRQTAKYKNTFNINGMVTGASLNKELNILLLSTYSSLLSVNIWAFTNYAQSNFFKGASKKLNFDPLQAQVEGITFIDNYKAYVSSEAFSKYIFSMDAKLYELDFSGEFE